ncbi:DNA-binding transcriptional LysR family regulator [Litorivivens lipolytica]|uniref:DNA-binding transcriptional LysR family regulator n=1 Tax=Litorivivens lipolytica TaxID=1524264 RepID=A0A7W4Z6H3_9GAMM|nr:DNA-binding transcriptional LysR family regulator [Litorivivens lipolytica]
MNLSRIDLNLFVVFETVFSQHSLTRAAEVLHVSQPAVSNSLSRLRKLFDDPLFVRSPGGMTPTPRAQQLICPVREALGLLDNCVSDRLAFDPKTARQTFRIHATEHAETHVLPKLVKKLGEQAPGISLEIVFLNRRDAPLAMARGELHLALDAPLLSHPELISRPLLKDEYVCIFRSGHPLARRRLTLKQYLASEHVHVSSRVKGSGHVDLALRSAGEQRRIALRLQHFTALPAILEQSDLLASIPAGATRGWPFPVRKLPFETPELALQVFWHRSVDHDPANRWLREALLDLSIMRG